METTEIIRILRQCGSCCLTDCSECPEYQKAEEGFRKDPETKGFMWSCGGVLLEAADRLALMEDIRKDMVDRTNENHRLKRQLKYARAERDAERGRLARLIGQAEVALWEEKPVPMDNGEYPPECPKEGM